MSLDVFQEHISSETGFVHYSHQVRGSRDCIPLFENLCHVLALFKAHTVEKGTLATILLDRLLAFQNDQGAFPRYIHEFPICSKPNANYHMLLPLHLINLRYSHVIESGTRARLAQSIEKLINYCKTFDPPPLLAERMAAIEGESVEKFPVRSSKEWAHHILSKQLVEPVEKLQEWHPNLNIYCGMPFNETQFGPLACSELIPPFLRPLFMSKTLPSGELVESRSVELDDWEWSIENSPDHSIATIKKFTPTRVPRGFHLIRALFPEGVSFVLPAGNYTFEDGQFTLSEEIPDYRDTMEVSFYITRHPAVKIYVEGERATTFRKGERVTIELPGHKIELSFDSEDDYFGHISYGNRPMQLDEDKFSSYDWRIGIRTVSRKPHSQLKVGLSTATPIACIPLST